MSFDALRKTIIEANEGELEDNFEVYNSEED